MTTIIKTYLAFVGVSLVWLTSLPALQAVVPSPDGGYPGFTSPLGPHYHNYVAAGSDGGGNVTTYVSPGGINWWIRKQNVYSITTPISANPRDAAIFYFAHSYWMVYTIGNFAAINTTNGSTAIVCPSGAFRAGDIGAFIAGGGIPTRTKITAFTDTQHVTISHAATATATGVFTWVTTTPGGFGLATSPDGVNNWSFVKNILLRVSGATATWMGRTLVDFDGTLHVFATATTAHDPTPATGMACYEVHPVSRYALNGTWSSGAIFYTNGSSKKYDIDVIRIGPLYHAFYCDGGGVRQGTSSTLTAATYNNDAVVHVGSVQFPIQSINVFPLNNDRWGMLGDRLDGGHITVATATSTANLTANNFAAQATQTTISIRTTINSNVITSSGAFTAAMAAQRWSITGAGIPPGTSIIGFTDASHVTIINNATATGTVTATVGTWTDNIPAMESPQMASVNGCLPVN